MEFLSFLALLGIAYLLWRLTDQIPDLIFRISEIQRDLAELLRVAKADSDADAADVREREAAASEASD